MAESSWSGAQTEEEVCASLEQRLGRERARLRLKIEESNEQIFGRGINFFHPENWYSMQSVLRCILDFIGLYERGRKNTECIEVRHNEAKLPGLPPRFAGFTILHISDMHIDLNPGTMRRLIEYLPDLTYDICVLTGDFRGETFGPYAATLAGLAQVRARLRGPVFGVLGNHDTIRMVPELEQMGIRMLLNEAESIKRGEQRIYLAGIDDAHYHRADDIKQAASQIPRDGFSILLSHTPEIYRQAAHAGFKLLLSGHTHGGQICLPGSIPITLDSVLPRRMSAGPWSHHAMAGYTSVGVGSSIVTVRFNCPPEITLHHLHGV